MPSLPSLGSVQLKPLRTTRRVPKYRLNKTTGRAVVTLNGVDHWLGKYGTPESRQAYDRLVAEWLANGRRVVDTSRPADITVNELLLRFWRHAETFYLGRDGKTSGELENFRHALRPLKELYGFTPAAAFGPKSLCAVRQRMIGMDWCRTYVNVQTSRIKTVFKWGTSQELVPPAVPQALATVTGLKKGKTEAREAKRVRKVSLELVEATKQFVSPVVADMIDLQLLAAMRPGEVVIVRGCDIETSEEQWVYRPAYHKTEHHDVEREIPLGPDRRT